MLYVTYDQETGDLIQFAEDLQNAVTPFVECSEEVRARFIKKIFSDNVINGYVVDISNDPEYLAKKLKGAKESKIAENEQKRQDKLLSGVVYKDVLFDSDTDQKSNLMYAIASMDDKDTITWYGMNNNSLVCTKSDLLAIGQLLQELTALVWGNLNPQYIKAIESATTIDELTAINIQY